MDMMEMFRVVWKRLGRYERFWQTLYYGATNLLIFAGAAALLVGLWYFLFCWR